MKARRCFVLFISAVVVMSAIAGLFTAAGAVDLDGDWTV